MSAALAGLRVVVTRARRKGEKFAAVLAKLGATPLLFPTIQTVAIQPNPTLDAANQQLDKYDWLIFTSPPAVRYWAKSIQPSAISRQPQVACVGSKTARAWQKVSGREADLLPETYTAVGLLAVMPDVRGQKILIPQSAIARDTLADGLRQAGALVAAIATYDTVLDEPTPEEWAALRAGADWLTFTSPSTFSNFVTLAGEAALYGAKIATIGPITAVAVEKAGVKVTAVAQIHTMDGLLEAILKCAQ